MHYKLKLVVTLSSLSFEIKLIGSIPWRMVYFCLSNYLNDSLNVNSFNGQLMTPIDFLLLKLLPAKTTSPTYKEYSNYAHTICYIPGSKGSISPHDSVISLSLILPPAHLETKDANKKLHCGVMLTITPYLRSLGLSMKISVLSITMQHFFKIF